MRRASESGAPAFLFLVWVALIIFAILNNVFGWSGTESQDRAVALVKAFKACEVTYQEPTQELACRTLAKEKLKEGNEP